jgi:hypothetical protein
MIRVLSNAIHIDNSHALFNEGIRIENRMACLYFLWLGIMSIRVLLFQDADHVYSCSSHDFLEVGSHRACKGSYFRTNDSEHLDVQSQLWSVFLGCTCAHVYPPLRLYRLR